MYICIMHIYVGIEEISKEGNVVIKRFRKINGDKNSNFDFSFKKYTNYKKWERIFGTLLGAKRLFISV